MTCLKSHYSTSEMVNRIRIFEHDILPHFILPLLIIMFISFLREVCEWRKNSVRTQSSNLFTRMSDHCYLRSRSSVSFSWKIFLVTIFLLFCRSAATQVSQVIIEHPLMKRNAKAPDAEPFFVSSFILNRKNSLSLHFVRFLFHSNEGQDSQAIRSKQSLVICCWHRFLLCSCWRRCLCNARS